MYMYIYIYKYIWLPLFVCFGQRLCQAGRDGLPPWEERWFLGLSSMGTLKFLHGVVHMGIPGGSPGVALGVHNGSLHAIHN